MTREAWPVEFFLAVDGNGGNTLLWTRTKREGDPDYGYFDISYSKMVSWRPGGKRVFTILGRTWDASGASIAGGPDGSTTVLWSNDFGRVGSGLFASTWTTDGKLSGPVMIDDNPAGYSRVAAGPDGNVVGVWIGWDGLAYTIRTASTLPAFCERADLKLGRVARRAKDGSLRLKIRLGSSGRVETLASRWISPTSTRFSRGGDHRIRVVPSRATRRLVAEHGRAAIKLRVRFEPDRCLRKIASKKLLFR
jgi:hypothetical protein